MKHLPEFLKTREGLFTARWGNMFLVISLVLIAALYKTLGIYITLLFSILSLVYIEINFFVNFRLITDRAYIKHDKYVWEEIEKMVPPLGSMHFLRNTDFYGRFDADRLQDIYTYSNTINSSVDKRFQDQDLEALRQQFSDLVECLSSEIGLLTYPHGDFQGVPVEWRNSNDPELRERFNKDSQRLTETKNQLIKHYDSLYHAVKRKLFVD